MLKFLVTMVTVISLSSTAGSLNEERSTATRLLRNEDNQCPPWTYYNASIEQCKCYNDLNFGTGYTVRCNIEQSILYYDFRMTFDEDSGISSTGFCPYFKLKAITFQNLSQE